jgi:hypothetical protein
MIGNSEKNRHPIITVWSILGTISAILSLSSISQNFVEWKGFIHDLILFYQQLTHPIYQFVFGWLPINIPTELFDYMTIGIIVAISAIKARDKSWNRLFVAPNTGIEFIYMLGFWPIVLIIYSVKAFKGNIIERNYYMYFVRIFGLIILGCTILYIVNQVSK